MWPDEYLPSPSVSLCGVGSCSHPHVGLWALGCSPSPSVSMWGVRWWPSPSGTYVSWTGFTGIRFSPIFVEFSSILFRFLLTSPSILFRFRWISVYSHKYAGKESLSFLSFFLFLFHSHQFSFVSYSLLHQFFFVSAGDFCLSAQICRVGVDRQSLSWVNWCWSIAVLL